MLKGFEPKCKTILLRPPPLHLSHSGSNAGKHIAEVQSEVVFICLLYPGA